DINAAFDAGIRIIGENRVQELIKKLPSLNPAFQIHLIGQLQLNKVKYIVPHIDVVQSVDRVALARALSARAAAAGRSIGALIQVNIAEEPQKGGVRPDGLDQLIREARHMEGLSLRGLMAIMPLADDPERVRPYFRAMRALYDRLRDEQGAAFDTLSMGMSGDCLVAAQEGATMVRLGTAIFGRRPPQSMSV
ncbi:MAG: YggS family pyridoxal phosphate-dependent enzyme, partial [Clostridiales bacterium]|nr:YggS family pyridoxal phosphate-dependent enzyme [Clostridiales bacterium]